MSSSARSVPVRVMAFNIELGGAYVSFDSVIDVIRVAEPDVVAVQEPYGELATIAERLGWHYDLRNHVISKWPLIDPPGADGRYLLVEVRPGRVVAIASVHLPSDPYGEDWIRDGRTRDEVVALERAVRVPFIQPFLAVLPELAEQGMPVFMAGDFNSPPGSDWQDEAIAKYPFRRYTVNWPVADAIAAAGFRDSYRDVYQDPLAKPGFTWWASRPPNSGYDPQGEGAWQSRIDFTWYAGPARVTASRIIGEEGAPDTDVAIEPWPSDHRALVSDFDTVPQALPAFVSVAQRVVYAGGSAVIPYNNTSRRGHLEVVHQGKPASSKRVELVTQRGQVSVAAPVQGDGKYHVRLYDASGRPVSETRFWFHGANAQPRVVLTRDAATCASGLAATWRNAPGHRYDWLGVFSEAADEPHAWRHIGAAIEGETCLDETTLTGTWPLPAGRYSLRLLLDDSYRLLAGSAEFQID